MALSDIVAKILAQAKLEAEQVERDLKAEAAAIFTENEKKIAAMKEQLATKTADKVKQMKMKTKVLIDSEKQNAILNKKRDILQDLFRRSREEFCAMSPSEMQEILTAAFAKIPESSGTVLPAAGATAVVKSAMKNAGQNFSLGDEGDFEGGFIFMGEKVEIDFSFAAVFEKEVRPKLELEISQMIFPN